MPDSLNSRSIRNAVVFGVGADETDENLTVEVVVIRKNDLHNEAVAVSQQVENPPFVADVAGAGVIGFYVGCGTPVGTLHIVVQNHHFGSYIGMLQRVFP